MRVPYKTCSGAHHVVLAVCITERSRGREMKSGLKVNDNERRVVVEIFLNYGKVLSTFCLISGTALQKVQLKTLNSWIGYVRHTCFLSGKHIYDGTVNTILLKIHISHDGKYFNTLLCACLERPTKWGLSNKLV